MPKYKRKSYLKKSFESDGSREDTSANIYMSMIMSKAWNDLSNRQRVLYLYCKAQYYNEKRKPVKYEDRNKPLNKSEYPEYNKTWFTMNQAKWKEKYKLYTNNSSFYADINSLIMHGFIFCVESGSYITVDSNETKFAKSIYAFSDKWQKYGTPEFEITLSEMTNAMKKKRKK